MKALIVGGDGFIGSALVRHLTKDGNTVLATTRRNRESPLFLDMLEKIGELPPVDVVFLVAAVQTFQGCEGNPEAYRVNVDATVEIARRTWCLGAFPVFISSDCVEWGGATAYARHKSLVEMVIHSLGGAIVRPSRVWNARVFELCQLLEDVGREKLAGVHRWPQ
jgi:dTDP-4-dehydrorhamnose reductase